MRSDLDLRQDIESELAFDPKIDASAVAVMAKDGAVTLTGRVGNYLEKCEAERIAKQVYGVTGVANDIEVRLDGGAQSDAELLQRVLRALEWNVAVPSSAIKPTIENGYVTLTGKVKWNFEREAAESAVRSLAGVKGVYNEITLLNSAPQPNDVRTRIVDALNRNAQIDARRITVTTRGNTAILDGSVDSWAERAEAEDAAWSAPGIASVENHLAVTC